MIPHNYVNASDDRAQYEADRCGRQEVTLDWYMEHGVDHDLSFFRWVPCQIEFGLDPWRYHMDMPIDPEEVQVLGWRIFVQRKDLERMGLAAPQPESIGVMNTLQTALDRLARDAQHPQVAARAGRAAVKQGRKDIEAARAFLAAQAPKPAITAAEADALDALLLRVTRPDMLRMGLTVPQAELALSGAVKLRQRLALGLPRLDGQKGA